MGNEPGTDDDAFVDQHGHTWERGPSDPPRLADGPGTFAEVDIDAPLADVWNIVTDISFGARFSEEFVGGRWVDGATGPALGARFIGTNRHPAMGEWEIPCFVDRFVEHAEFGWRTSDPDRPGARWCYVLRRVDGVTRLRHTLALGPGPSRIDDVIARMPDKEHRIIRVRLDEHRANMQRVVAGIAAAATDVDGGDRAPAS